MGVSNPVEGGCLVPLQHDCMAAVHSSELSVLLIDREVEGVDKHLCTHLA